MQRIVYVRNDTGVDLWANVAVDDEGLIFVIMPWTDMPTQRRRESDRLDAGQIGDFHVPNDLPTDPLTGMTKIKLQIAAEVNCAAKIVPNGMNGQTLIALFPAPN